jgi:AcrR family transcriptional regulator
MRSSAAPSSAPVVRGRPRSLRAKRAVLEAVRALFEKGGYSAATIEAIAARSGVAKTTIYRWWPSRAALVVDLLVQIAAEVAPVPSGRDPMQALRIELRLVAEAVDELPGQMLLSLLGEAQRDQDVHDALVQRLFNPRRKATANFIRQAQVSGALRPDVPPLVAVDLLFGPLFYRAFVLHESVTGHFVNQMIQLVLGGLLAPPARRKP